jgi:hypothetical protein
MCVERGRERDNDPYREPDEHDLAEARMLGKPPPAARERPNRVSAGIDPAPRGRAAGPSGERFVHMHHELVVRKLVLASLVKDSLVEVLAIPCVGVGGRTLFPCRVDDHGGCVRPAAVWFSVRENRSGRQIKGLGCADSHSRLAPPYRCRLARNIGLRRLGMCRRRSGDVVGRFGCVSVVLKRRVPWSRDVERHKPVARELLAPCGLLRYDLTDQLCFAAERTIEAGAQPGTADSLRGVRCDLAHIFTDHEPPRRAAPARRLGVLGTAYLSCRSVAHRGC